MIKTIIWTPAADEVATFVLNMSLDGIAYEQLTDRIFISFFRYLFDYPSVDRKGLTDKDLKPLGQWVAENASKGEYKFPPPATTL